MARIKSIQQRVATVSLDTVGLPNTPRITGWKLVKIRERIILRDGAACKKCGYGPYDLSQLEVDHIVPLCSGGSESDENRQLLCKRCHRLKSDEEERLRRQVYG